MQISSVDQLVGQVLGTYRVERLLGKGRLNAVYLARSLSSQRTDALTLYLVPEHLSVEARTRFLARFRKEAAVVTRLDHPHILPVYEYGEQAGFPYLVTPYMTHGSLADMLKRAGRYDHVAVQSLLEQIVAGLDYAHRKGFVHGTLKPATIVVNNEDMMQVAGFGLMHMLQVSGIERLDQPYAHLLSIAGTFLAAPEYVAPEVVQGEIVDARSDIYALGCILFELLCGRPPFTGSDPLELATQHVKQAAPALRSFCPDVPVVVASVINQALERDPARRFGHIGELGEAFAQASRGASSQRRSHGERLQETPREGYAASKWQLMPPIVTGKLPAITIGTNTARPPISAPPTIGNEEAWREGEAPQGPTNRFSTAQPSPVAPRPAAPPVSRRPLQDEPTLIPSAPAAVETAPNSPPTQPATYNSLPGANADADLARAYAWWSQPGEVSPSPKLQEPARGGAQEPAQAPLRLRQPDLVDWSHEPMMPNSLPTTRSQPVPNPGRKVGRRKVVAMLATGGVVAAGAAVALKFHAFGLGAPATSPVAPVAQKPVTAQPAHKPAQKQGMGQGGTAAPQKAPTNPPQQQQPPQQKQQAPQQPPAAGTGGHMGTVVGNKTLALNSRMDFKNPADNKDSLLIHLANGSFVAYEKACTHEGVLVDYDPQTKMLVCPAHGAIFDPANKGAVIQGPAEKPLPMVNIKVNADGTITTV